MRREILGRGGGPEGLHGEDSAPQADEALPAEGGGREEVVVGLDVAAGLGGRLAPLRQNPHQAGHALGRESDEAARARLSRWVSELRLVLLKCVVWVRPVRSANFFMMTAMSL